MQRLNPLSTAYTHLILLFSWPNHWLNCSLIDTHAPDTSFYLPITKGTTTIKGRRPRSSYCGCNWETHFPILGVSVSASVGYTWIVQFKSSTNREINKSKDPQSDRSYSICISPPVSHIASMFYSCFSLYLVVIVVTFSSAFTITHSSRQPSISALTNGQVHE